MEQQVSLATKALRVLTFAILFCFMVDEGEVIAATDGSPPAVGKVAPAVPGVALPEGAAAAPLGLAPAAQRFINCRNLRGAGSFSNPVQVGRITGITVVYGCPGLSSGRPFNVRYFGFSTVRRAIAGSAIGTRFITRPGATSAVHPRLALPNGFTLLTSSARGFWVQQPPAWIRYLPVQGLFAGRYIFGAEKLSSPLGSLRTPVFDVIFYL